MGINALIYDIEIVKAIPPKTGPLLEGIEYCKGWHDHAGMGISCLCAYDYLEGRYRVFTDSNKGEFERLMYDRNLIIGFNSISFDFEVLKACWNIVIPPGRDFDLLVEIWKGAGLGPKFEYPSHMGYGLDACCAANFGTKKTGHGADAPLQWQRGDIGGVIDYCLQDVRLTKQLFDLIVEVGFIKSPVDATKVITIARPVGL